GRIDIGTATVGHEEGAAGAAVLGDAVGIGEREKRADRSLLPSPRRLSLLFCKQRRIRLCNLRPPPGHRPRLGRTLRAITAQRVEPMTHIDAVPADTALAHDAADLSAT